MKIFFGETNLKKVVIVGGGFGGLELAKKLNNKKFTVILLDCHNYHTFQPLLYQVATGGLDPDSVAYPVRKIVQRRKNIFFRLGEALQVIPGKNILVTSIGEIEYDHLVIATGSTTNFFGNKNLERNCLTLKSIIDALNVRSFLLQNFEQALLTPGIEERKSLMNIVIAGGGPTGVEVAGAVAELKRHVLPYDYKELDLSLMNITLIEASGKLLAMMSEKASEKAKEFLEGMGVHVRLNQRVKDFDGKKITLDGGEEIITRSMIWTAGVMGKLIKGIDDTSLAKGNRLAVDEFNLVRGQKNIYAIGDAASMVLEDKPPHPMVAPVAIQQGKNLADNLNKNSIATWKPFRYHDKGTLATIGRNKAVADLKLLKFQGFFAWITWVFVHIMTLVGFRNKVIVLINWIWSYFSYENAIRLIIRPYKKSEDKDENTKR
jgi:NADH dehydrogenase